MAKALQIGEVHVWRLPLPLHAGALAAVHDYLNDEERARAARFRQLRDRETYIACRGALRDLLGRYLDRLAADLVFGYAEHGKPYLVDADLQFNVAHSAGLALIAFGMDPVGVDVEPRNRKVEARKVANRYFCATEVAELEKLNDHDCTDAFLAGWTRKEAFIKAVGDGLRMPLHSFEVSLDRGCAKCLLGIDGNSAKAAGWTLTDLDVPATHVAALAVEQPCVNVRMFDYSGRT